MDILKEIKIFLNKYKLLNKTSHFLVGFSGGADSMLLLYLLNELKNEFNFKLSALHINHNWRGKESDREQNVCEKFCKKYKIDFYCEKFGEDIKQDENSARIARYILFKKYSQKLKSNVVVTAHNSTDVVETFIYRLAKGMGTTGAMSIPEIRDEGDFIICRPLINISSEEIRNACKKLKLKYNIDSSNNNNKYKRNLIRNEILPQLKKINPEYEAAILNFIENMKSNNKIIEDICYQSCEEVIKNNKIITSLFMPFSEDIKRVIIYKYLKNNDFEPEKKIILSMIKQIEKNADKPNGKLYSIKSANEEKNTYSFFCSKSECYFVKEKKQKNICKVFEKKIENPFKISAYNGEKIPKSTDKSAVINIENLKFPLELRTRKNGDIFQPFSHKTKIKLKDYLIEKKIPAHKRDEIPLLCCGKEVLWIIGVGISEKLRADLSDPKNCILIKYKK